MASKPTPETPQGISALGLVSVGFFWVAGGSYGNEALILAAPPGILLLGVGAVGLVYGVPLALITAELGTGFPAAGGMAQWVELAFGETIGAHNAWWIWISYVVDSAIYPVLAARYLALYVGEDQVSWLDEKLYASFIVFVMTVVKLMGRSVLEYLSTVLAVIALAPSLIYWPAGLAKAGVDWEYVLSVEGDPCTLLATEVACTAPNATSCTWSDDPLLGAAAGADPDGSDDSSWGSWSDSEGPGCEGLDLSLLVSYVLWLYSGFMSLGTLAGELADPVRAYWTALLILVPSVVTLNCMPLIVSVTLDHDRNNFSPGYFQVLAGGVTGDWMKTVYFIGSQVSLYGLYNSGVIVAECTLPPFAEKYLFGPVTVRDTGLRAMCLRGNGEEEPGSLYVLFNMLVCCGLVWAPYALLVEVTMLITIVMSYPFLLSFVYLRVTEPNIPRPFRVPGGTIAACLWTLPPMVLGTAYLYVCVFVDVDNTYGIRYFNVLCCAAVVLLGLMVQLLSHCCAGAGLITPRSDSSRIIFNSGDHYPLSPEKPGANLTDLLVQ